MHSKKAFWDKKNPKKKGKRILKRYREIPTDTVTWVGRSFSYGEPTPATGTGTPQRRHWVRGHWWPRRDTIQRRIEDAQSDHRKVLDEYRDLKDAVSNAASPEDASDHLVRLAFLRGKAQKAESEIKSLSERLESRRRWVKPYQKGSRGSTPTSHTYMLGSEEGG